MIIINHFLINFQSYKECGLDYSDYAISHRKNNFYHEEN